MRTRSCYFEGKPLTSPGSKILPELLGLQKLFKTAFRRCCIHFKEGNGTLTPFSSVSFEKFRQCHELWANLDGQQRQIVEETSGILNNVANKSSVVSDFFYHRTCYSKFTNTTNIKRSQARCAKIMENRTEDRVIQEQDNCTQPPKKMLRSSMPSTSTTSRSTTVLPPTCIICNKDEVYVTDTVSQWQLPM